MLCSKAYEAEKCRSNSTKNVQVVPQFRLPRSLGFMHVYDTPRINILSENSVIIPYHPLVNRIIKTNM